MSAPGVNVHAELARSRANGPGERYCVWVQGCPLACPGCFNPETHDPAEHRLVPVPTLAARIVAAAPTLDGLTVSGGEPFAQAPALATLLGAVRRATGLSILVFTGYTLREIRADPTRARVLPHVDVLVAGRYVARQDRGRALLGSANQRIHLLTPRHSLEEVQATPELELHVARDGRVLASGVGAAGVTDFPLSGARRSSA